MAEQIEGLDTLYEKKILTAELPLLNGAHSDGVALPAKAPRQFGIEMPWTVKQTLACPRKRGQGWDYLSLWHAFSVDKAHLLF